MASDWLRHFRLLLWNRWMEFNKSWQEAKSQRPLLSLFFLGWSVKQDGHPGIWIAETFSTRLHIVLRCTICGPLGLLLVMVVTRRTFCLLTIIFVVSVTVVCGEPPDVPLSSKVVNGLETGDNATYTCGSGYAIAGQSVNVASATCQSDGSWTGVPSCVGNLFLIFKEICPRGIDVVLQ